MQHNPAHNKSRETEVPVVFRPGEKTVYVLPGTSVLEAAVGAGMIIGQPCGGTGKCGKCCVSVVQGTGISEATPSEADAFSAGEIEAGSRLACQASITGPATIEVPDESLLTAQYKILAQGEATSRFDFEPAVSKQYVELPQPARGDDVADVVRLRRAVGPIEVDLDVLQQLPRRLRANDFRGTVVVAHDRLIDFEPGDTTAHTYTVAIDIGTTTLAGVLLDAGTGRRHATCELAVASRLNPQIQFGDDVLSRILHAGKDDGLEQLQQAILEAVDQMIGELAVEASVRREHIYEIVCSGNTTMQQLLCGIDPKALGEVPFVPAMGRQPLILDAAGLNLSVHPRAKVCIVPVIGGFVGGDTVSGILASELTEPPGPSLFVDVGTNGEIVLCADGKLSAASTAAGPAFEGARILHGMRGAQGAIEKVTIDSGTIDSGTIEGHLRINVIGNVPPVGLCGSALIDVAAELLNHGLLSAQGRLAKPEELPDGTLPDLVERLITFEKQPAFLLASAGETGHGKPVVLTQRDFRELQLATGAIRAGITILMRRAGIEPEQLDSVLIAGGFGNFIRRSNAQRIGLLPSRVPHHRIRYQGNTSLAGARLMALSKAARLAAEDFARRTEHVDLSFDADFQMEFAEAMIFPDDE